VGCIPSQSLNNPFDATKNYQLIENSKTNAYPTTTCFYAVHRVLSEGSAGKEDPGNILFSLSLAPSFCRRLSTLSVLRLVQRLWCHQ
jgi:hypothetical protein